MRLDHVTLRGSGNYRSQGSWTREEQRGQNQQIKEQAQEKALQKQERKAEKEMYNLNPSKRCQGTALTNQTNLGTFQNLVLHIIGSGLAAAPIAISAWHMFSAK